MGCAGGKCEVLIRLAPKSTHPGSDYRNENSYDDGRDRNKADIRHFIEGARDRQ